MIEFIFQASFWVFAGSMLWLIWAGYGWHRGTFKDLTNVIISWRRITPPALTAGVAIATHFALLPTNPAPPVGVVLLTWVITAAVFTGASFLSGGIMMAIVRRAQERELQREAKSRLGAE